MQDKTPDVFEEDDRCCAFCEKGTRVPSGELVICPKKGLVDGRYICGAFSYDPLKREPKRKNTELTCEFIDIDE